MSKSKYAKRLNRTLNSKKSQGFLRTSKDEVISDSSKDEVISGSFDEPWKRFDASMTFEQWEAYVEDINTRYPTFEDLKSAGLNLQQFKLYLLSWDSEAEFDICEMHLVRVDEDGSKIEYEGLCLKLSIDGCFEFFPFPDAENHDTSVPLEVIDFVESIMGDCY